MLDLRGYYDGTAFQPLEKVELQKNQQVIITVLDDATDLPKKNNEERLQKIKALSGSLAEYAIKDGRSIDEIMELESKAWEQAAIEKYAKADV